MIKGYGQQSVKGTCCSFVKFILIEKRNENTMLNKNPYDVLGIPHNASDDEVKKAYRDLTRKYHPDANVNNPLADLAEEKFKEVQEAYDMIMKEREQGSGSYSYGSGSYSSGGYGSAGGYGQNRSNSGYGRGQSYQYDGSYQRASYGQDDPRMQSVYTYMNARQYREALNVLNSIPGRNAQWYYISAVANANLGNNVTAREQAAQAVNMEPSNPQYREFMTQLQWNGQRYQSSPFNRGYGNQGDSCGTGNICCDLWCADTLCECMGGDLCSCM